MSGGDQLLVGRVLGAGSGGDIPKIRMFIESGLARRESWVFSDLPTAIGETSLGEQIPGAEKGVQLTPTDYSERSQSSHVHRSGESGSEG